MLFALLLLAGIALAIFGLLTILFIVAGLIVSAAGWNDSELVEEDEK